MYFVVQWFWGDRLIFGSRRNVYIVRCHILLVDMSENGHIVYKQNTNTHGENNVGNACSHIMGMFRNLYWLVPHIGKTLCPPNTHGGKNVVAHPQAKRSMQREKMHRDKTQGPNHRFSMPMRIQAHAETPNNK